MLGRAFTLNGENGTTPNPTPLTSMVAILSGRLHTKMFVYGNADFKVKGENQSITKQN